MRDHLLYEKFYDFHSRGPYPEHFGPRGCRPHCHGPTFGPHHHGRGPWGHGPFGHGHHRRHFHVGCDRHHREFDFFGPRSFNPWDRFRHFDGPDRPTHFGRPGPSFFGRANLPDRRADCPFGRSQGKGNCEEQTFVFRGVVIEQDKDKRPSSV